MRNTPLKGLLKKSPIKYDFTKKKTFGEGKIGKKIADAVTPKSMLDVIPVGKAVKALKTGYNLLTS